MLTSTTHSPPPTTPLRHNSPPKQRRQQRDTWETDSDEDVRERILKLPPQARRREQLFSIPEVTEDEDNSMDESEPQRPRARARSRAAPHPQARRAQPVPLQSSLRATSHQGRRAQHHVHYADEVATVSYPEVEDDAGSDSSLYDGPDSHKIWSHREAIAAPQRSAVYGGGGGGGGGDRLRREALLRRQMISHAAETPGAAADGAYLVSRTVHRVKSPTGSRVEIDVEYGTDNDEDTPSFDPGEVVVDQMSSEWWVEEGHHECHRPVPAPRRPQGQTRALPSSGHHAWVC